MRFTQGQFKPLTEISNRNKRKRRKSAGHGLQRFRGRHLWASELRRAENLERLAGVGIHGWPRGSSHDMSGPHKCRSTLSHAVLVDRRARVDVASALASAQAYAPQHVFA